MAPRMKVETSIETSAPQEEQKAVTSTPPKKETTAPKAKVEAPKAKVEAPKTTVEAPRATVEAPKAQAEPSKQEHPRPKSTPKPRMETTQTSNQHASSQVIQEEPVDAGAQRTNLNDVKNSATGWVHRTFPGHEHAFMGGVIALLVALLTFAIGFPRMLLICVLVVVGIAIGQMLDGDPKIIRWVRNLLDSERDQS